MKKTSSSTKSHDANKEDVDFKKLTLEQKPFAHQKKKYQSKKSFPYQKYSKNKPDKESSWGATPSGYKKKNKYSRQSPFINEDGKSTAKKQANFNKSLKGNRKALREGKQTSEGKTPIAYVRPKRIVEEPVKIEYKATFPMPLNKYVAHCGVCSRREAASVVKEGRVTLNGVLTTTPGIKVQAMDEVCLDKKIITIKKELIYIMLNKPKGYICTKDDEKERKTIFELIDAEVAGQLHSVGRLDRDTTGVILLTNDGELTQLLSHPSYMVPKLYHVELDKPLSSLDSKSIMNGVTLEDGLITADELAYTNPKNKKQIGLLLHSGKNRIVRRIFEHLGYDVVKLDRVAFSGITKKNVARSHWRLLTAVEIRNLKNFNPIYQQKKSTIDKKQ